MSVSNNAPKIIEILENKLTEIPRLKETSVENREFKRWLASTKNVLLRLDKRYYEEFGEISFLPNVFSIGDNKEVFRESLNRGLDEASAYIDSVIEDLKLWSIHTENEYMANEINKTLLDEIAKKSMVVKNSLIDIATGGEKNSLREQNYNIDRKKLMSSVYSTHDDGLIKLIPQIVKNYQTLNSFWGFIKDEFAHYKDRRQYINEQFIPFDNLVEQIELSQDSITLPLKAEGDCQFHDSINKIMLHIKNGNYDSAITATRTLIQEVEEKIIRDITGKNVDEKFDADVLHKKVMTLLKLDASRDYDKRLKMVITGLNQVNSGIAQIRNVASDAHSPKYKAQKHHAILAANSAITLCQFLLDSQEYQKAN